MLKRVIIGKILAAHGVRGEMRILPLTDFPERFNTLKEAYLQDGRRVIVEAARAHKQFILIKLQGFDTPESVEPLRGLTLTVDRKDAVPLPAGHFYIFEIIGLRVFSQTGEELGVITDVIETGSNDVYVTEQSEKEGKKRQILIPALKEVVLEIDVAAQKMLVRLPEGLI